ncbi:hypothetical protein C8Q80DRAFT_1129014 [Daedaleopsis nitida]|nr:hypothetical protein C8Q80DRAFT_1129014 [Daedaleopsis nitida]
MHALRAGLDLSNAFDAAVYALACAAFWGCRRLGELLIPSRNKFDATRHVSRTARPQLKTIRGGCAYTMFHIPWTKSTKLEGTDVILTEMNDPSDPCLAIQHHMKSNMRIPPSAAQQSSCYAARTRTSWRHWEAGNREHS